jgi:hypothetical protein
MRAKIFLDYILLNLDIKTQITCNYHAVAIPVTNGKGVKPMATESDASRTERARAKQDLAYNSYILCSQCKNIQSIVNKVC